MRPFQVCAAAAAHSDSKVVSRIFLFWPGLTLISSRPPVVGGHPGVDSFRPSLPDAAAMRQPVQGVAGEPLTAQHFRPVLELPLSLLLSNTSIQQVRRVLRSASKHYLKLVKWCY